MAHSKSAKKRIKIAERNRQRNKSMRSKYKTSLKKVKSSISEGVAEEMNKSLSMAQKLVDKAARKGVIHKNKAARLKSRITISLNKALKEKAS